MRKKRMGRAWRLRPSTPPTFFPGAFPPSGDVSNPGPSSSAPLPVGVDPRFKLLFPPEIPADAASSTDGSDFSRSTSSSWTPPSAKPREQVNFLDPAILGPFVARTLKAFKTPVRFSEDVVPTTPVGD